MDSTRTVENKTLATTISPVACAACSYRTCLIMLSAYATLQFPGVVPEGEAFLLAQEPHERAGLARGALAHDRRRGVLAPREHAARERRADAAHGPRRRGVSGHRGARPVKTRAARPHTCASSEASAVTENTKTNNRITSGTGVACQRGLGPRGWRGPRSLKTLRPPLKKARAPVETP